MIIIQLNGGIGNQMFQYAVGRALSIKNNTDLLFDIGQYDNNIFRQFRLDQFKINARVATKAEIAKNKPSGIVRFIEQFRSFSSRTYIKERKYDFDAEVLNAKNAAYIEGYFQSPKYFSSIADTVRKEFRLKNIDERRLGPVLSRIRDSESVSLHIRRDDYLASKNQKMYVQIPIDFYEKAVSVISNRSNKIDLFIFSDDIEWVKVNFKAPDNASVLFVSGLGFTDAEELFLMSQCKHNITANSTFSWWGAWLNEDPEKNVITPKKWFIDPKKDEKDLIPEQWIKL